MDVLIAAIAPEVEATLRDTLVDVLGRLWPVETRQDVVHVESGVAIAASRTLAAADVIGPPRLHHDGGRVWAKRWDWATLASLPPASFGEHRGAWGSAASGRWSCNGVQWNTATQTLEAVRDAFGEGSIWYAIDGPRFALASHPAPLLALEWVSNEPDPIDAQLVGLPLDRGDRSGWQMLRRLPAGHRLIWRDGRIEITRWWQLGTPPPAQRCDDADWLESARTALERAVARRIPAAGVVGGHLSGGLDSTAVSILAGRALAPLDRRIHTFSHVPAVRWNPPRPGDETPYVEAALQAIPNAISHLCSDAAGDGTRFDGRALSAHDRAVRDSASGAGVCLMLSGWGGDEGISFNGDGYLARQLLRLQLLPALRWCWQYGGGTPRGMVGALLNKLVYQQFGLLRPTPVHPNPSTRTYRERILGLSGEARAVALRSYRASWRLRAGVGAHENQRRLLSSPHIANRIDADAEWSIPAGFCFRYPLLDPEVIQVALQVPERLLVLNGRTRTLLREAMRGLYPDLIQDRRSKFVSHPKPPVFRALK